MAIHLNFPSIKKYLEIFLINVIFLILGIIFFYILNFKVEMLGAFLAAGISFSFGVQQYRLEYDKMFKELFTKFNERYDLKFNEVLNNIDSKNKNDLNYQLSKDEILILKV